MVSGIFSHRELTVKGETGIVLDFLDAHPDLRFSRVVVDLGAYDCKTFSNSYNLILDYGWSGLLVEPFALNFARCAPHLEAMRARGRNVSWTLNVDSNYLYFLFEFADGQNTRSKDANTEKY